MFKAYRVNETDEGYQGAWLECSPDELPDGQVLIKVSYSSVNYKDALSASGNKGVTKAYPHTPGIDAAGVVVESASDRFKPGTEVVVFGYDLGMNTWGGFSQMISVPADWVLEKPKDISLADTMAWGTAGFTAAISVHKLLQYGVTPKSGSVVVTGATGGVGSVTVALLSKLGFEVHAVSAKEQQAQWLESLGATKIISRDEILSSSGKVMARPLYAGAIDTVGGDFVSALIPVISPEGAITTCGMVAGSKFSASIFPFILRGVALLGVDSVEIPLARKQYILDKIANEWALPHLEDICSDISPDSLTETLDAILNGKGVGRYRLILSE